MKKKLLTILCSSLMLVAMAGVMSACNFGGATESSVESNVEKATATVHFDVNTTLQTNVIKDKTVTLGKRVSKPTAVILEDNPTNLQVYGWYTSPDFTEEWDFKKGKVEGDMTLYAKWVELYDVDYYVNGALTKTANVFKGDLLVEDATIVEGFKYYGTYINAEHTEAWDFTKPVEGNMSVYVKRSEGIYLSDHKEEGELSSSTLTENIVAYLGTYGEKDEEGWVEEYTVQTVYDTGAVEEQCTYVNFGYAPTVGDGYIELCRSFDITQSQIIRIWYKNLGKADSMCMYFTTLMDPEKNVYSETGMNYSQNFCYPNYIGNDGARLYCETEMEETDEWACLEFNLYEIYKNGYSIWGTSPYLGALRLQANYKSNPDEKDFSNAFLIKSIEGVPYDVVVEDSEEVRAELDTAKGLDEEVLQDAANTQIANPNGFVFPKDFANVGEITDNATVTNNVNGILFRSDDEIVARETGERNGGFSIFAPEGKEIDLSENTTLSVTLKNYGYAESLIMYVYNTDNVAVKAEFSIATRMMESKTYVVNLYGAFGMEGILKKVEIYYSAVGVDNVISFEKIAFDPFIPYDTVGINLNDKYAYGFSSTSQIGVDFVSDRNGTRFDVLESGASLTTAEKTYSATTDGYSNATLKYIVERNSEITEVWVQYKINGEFTSAYKYVLNLENIGKANEVTMPFNANERGYVEALKLTFIGTGKIIIQGIDYTVGETGLPFYKSYENVYNNSDWIGQGDYYSYDEGLKASLLTKGKNNAKSSLSIYIGYSRNNLHWNVPHTTYSVLTTETTKVKIVYQNKTSVNTMLVHVQFAKSETGTSESINGTEYPILGENVEWEIDSNMAEYEWSTLTIEVPITYVNTYLAKVNMRFAGNEIAIRAIAIET
ncbi:MAG: InlB B-repeat-containing protein [Clostridia bacterium]|nr:InlB B-repeat-containing protein [Clostridia bacterium]